MELENNVNKVSADNLCISCGICKGACPYGAIDLVWDSGLYVSRVDKEKCVNCGICMEVCPGRGLAYSSIWKKNGSIPQNPYVGVFKEAFVAQSKNKDILREATSGGVVTTLIKFLLDEHIYDVAFLPSEQCSGNLISTTCCKETGNIYKSCKSRYVPIEQSQAVKYMLAHRNEKIILVGTSCFIQGIVKLIERYTLKRENYLLIGLFCDRNMNYNVFHYFSDFARKYGKLERLVFRSKEYGGWPGNICLEMSDGTKKEIDSLERIWVKDFFQLEGCFYCLDKLNQFADISVGDNYTKEYDEGEGTSSVIVRTCIGNSVWKKAAHLFSIWNSSIQKIEEAQLISQRKKNYYMRKIKSQSSSVILKGEEIFSDNRDSTLYRKEYGQKIKKLKWGRKYSWWKLRLYMRFEHSCIRRNVLNLKFKLHDIKTKLINGVRS